MARKTYRGGRIGEEIKRIIGDMLLRELKDPRFSGFVSVSGVKAADDGSFATVYITMLGSSSNTEATEDEKRDVLRAFESAKGLIRREIGSRMRLRHTPDLQFRFDTSGEYGRHIEKLIGSLDIASGGPDDDMDGDSYENKGNVEIPVLADVIDQAHTIHIFPHENMDGDTLGSAVALCLVLRAMGKSCTVIIDEKIPDNIQFVENHCTVQYDAAGFHVSADRPGEQTGPNANELEDSVASLENAPDLAIMMDVGELDRLNTRAALFTRAAATVCIDHHLSTKAIYDYNLVDTGAAATAEIVFDLLRGLGASIDERIAEALYVGLVTDTGRFQYANTTVKSHHIAAELLCMGVNPSKVSIEVYQNLRIEKLYLENAVLGTMTSIAGGKGVVAYMTRNMLAETGAFEEETEGIAEKLRTIRGVEVSVFIRETADGKTKGSLRSKSYYNAAELAGRFGGGGHAGAAGFSSERPLEEVLTEINAVLRETL